MLPKSLSKKPRLLPLATITVEHFRTRIRGNCKPMHHPDMTQGRKAKGHSSYPPGRNRFKLIKETQTIDAVWSDDYPYQVRPRHLAYGMTHRAHGSHVNTVAFLIRPQHTTEIHNVCSKLQAVGSRHDRQYRHKFGGHHFILPDTQGSLEIKFRRSVLAR